MLSSHPAPHSLARPSFRRRHVSSKAERSGGYESSGYESSGYETDDGAAPPGLSASALLEQHGCVS